jgi:hypothetical protein
MSDDHRNRLKVRCITIFGRRTPENVAGALGEIKRAVVESTGLEVQMTRYTSNVLDELPTGANQAVIDAAKEFETLTSRAGISTTSLGCIRSGELVRNPAFLKQLLTETKHAFVSVAWQYDECDPWGFAEAYGIATAMFDMEASSAGTNFRFGVGFHCEEKFIPFFPASCIGAPASPNPNTQADRLAFSVGLENSALLQHAYESCDPSATDPIKELREKVKSVFSEALVPIENACQLVADRLDIDFKGIDTSIAPDLRGAEHDMAKCVALPGSPLFEAGTVATIDAITSALRDVPGITTVGYRGVMLPVLENESLVDAVRRSQLTVDKLLLYSTVCGVGIDVVPIAAGVHAEEREAATRRVAGLILDVAAISRRQAKPLSVRILPCLGKNNGQKTTFESQYLINGVAM